MLAVISLDSVIPQMHRLIAPLASLTLLAACASHPKPAPPKVAVKTIAVVPASNPRAYTLLNLSSLAFVIPISQTFNYMDSKQKEALLNERLKPRGSKLASDFTDCVVTALRGYGYRVDVLENVERPADDPDDVDTEKLATTADAVLQIKFSEVGLFSPRSSTFYLPRVNAHGRLVVKGREDDLYDEDVVYGVDARAGKAGEIVGDASFAYADFDGVMTGVDSVRTAFRTGADKVCRVMASQVNDAIK